MGILWLATHRQKGIPAEKSVNITTMRFFNRQNSFFGYQLTGSTNSELVIECFESFADEIIKSQTPKKHTGGVPLVIIDNAPRHTSEVFLAKIEHWKKKNLFIQFIPAYCPELNYIEILWKHIKYHWMKIDAYKDINTLSVHLDDILNKIGSEYRINFK